MGECNKKKSRSVTKNVVCKLKAHWKRGTVGMTKNEQSWQEGIVTTHTHTHMHIYIYIYIYIYCHTPSHTLKQGPTELVIWGISVLP